jgi:hypothetical protein
MKKVVPSERLRRELDDVLAGIGEEQDLIEAVARFGARLILQQALQDEVTQFVRRGRYARADGCEEMIYRKRVRPAEHGLHDERPDGDRAPPGR